MRPVFEHAFVDALGVTQIGAAIGGNAIPENVMVTALNHMDGINLHVTEMLDRISRRLRALAERSVRIKPLGAQPDRSRCGFRQRNGIIAWHGPIT